MVSELDTDRCASEEAEPRMGVDMRWCQQGRWAPKEGGLGSPTSIGEGNECKRGLWTSKGGGW